MILARSGDDFSFIFLDRFRIDTTGLDVSGASLSAAGLQAYIYGKRDIYRPGETLDGAMLVRDGRIVGFWTAADGVVPGDTGGIRDVFVRDRGDLLGPTVTDVAADPASPSIGQSLAITATVDDAARGGSVVAAAEVSGAPSRCGRAGRPSASARPCSASAASGGSSGSSAATARAHASSSP